MAKRKSNRKHTSKIEPSVLTMTYGLAVPPGIANFTIDLSQSASILNRRFYRQGLNWAVSGFKIRTVGAGIGTVGVAKLPNTWTLSNAWEKVFRAWNRQQREALEDGQQESVRARFNDFKIFADSTHLSAGFAGNLLPSDNDGNLAVAGEWEASQLVIPNFGAPGVNFEPFITAVGPNVGGAGGAYSLIQMYEDSRSVPFSPDPDVPAGVLSTDNILNLMFDVGDNNTDVITNAIGKNNDLPYVQDDYPGGATQLPALQSHDATDLSATSISGSSYLKGGNFPCGLIRVDTQSTAGFTAVLLIDLVPGHHRGYMCEPMTEM